MLYLACHARSAELIHTTLYLVCYTMFAVLIKTNLYVIFGLSRYVCSTLWYVYVVFGYIFRSSNSSSKLYIFFATAIPVSVVRKLHTLVVSSNLRLMAMSPTRVIWSSAVTEEETGRNVGLYWTTTTHFTCSRRHKWVVGDSFTFVYLIILYRRAWVTPRTDVWSFWLF